MYQYVRGNPLKYVDPSGEEIWIWYRETITRSDGVTGPFGEWKRVRYHEGKVYNEDGSKYAGSDGFVATVQKNLDKLREMDGFYKHIIGTLENSSRTHKISNPFPETAYSGVSPENEDDALKKVPTGSDMTYNPEMTPTDEGGVDREAGLTTLAHELSHAYDFEVGDLDRSINSDGAKRSETKATDRANRIFILLGEAPRLTYGTAVLSDRNLPHTREMMQNQKRPAITLTPRCCKRNP